jgi:hypothetical protein
LAIAETEAIGGFIECLNLVGFGGIFFLSLAHSIYNRFKYGVILWLYENNFAADYLGIPCVVDENCTAFTGVCMPSKRCALEPLNVVRSIFVDSFIFLSLF